MANLRPQERMAYLTSLDREKDYKNTMAYAEEAAEARGGARGVALGEVKGKHEKAVETALKMLLKGYNKEEISDILGLPIEEIEKLK